MTAAQAHLTVAWERHLSHFGQEITFTPAVGSPSTVTGHFDEEGLLRSPENIDVITTQPLLWLRPDDPASVAKNDRFTIAGTVRYVIQTKLDSTGTKRWVALSEENIV